MRVCYANVRVQEDPGEMLEERAADRHDANVGAMGYRAKENRQQHGADRGLSYRVVCGAEAWRLARRPSRVTEGEMDEQRGDVSSVRHRSSLAPFILSSAPRRAGKLSTPYAGVKMSKMVIDRCLAISGLGSIYVAVDRPITDYPYARMRLPNSIPVPISSSVLVY